MVGDEGWQAIAAVTFAFLLVTSMTMPVGALNEASRTASSDLNSPTEASLVNSSQTQNSSDSIGNAPPLYKKHDAIQRTHNLSADGRRGIASNIDRARERFNTSLSYYQGPYRVNESKAFTHDAVGVRALAHTTRTDSTKDARKVADLIYSADNVTATVTVADARRVLDKYGDQMDNEGLRISAEKHLENAERALERGQNVGDADGRRYFGQRARAITQFRQAHRHARIAMRFVDREVTPSITVETDEDPIWNGTGTKRYTIRGSVVSVQPSTVGNATVVINDNRTIQTHSSVFSTAPGRNTSFQVTVNLTKRVNTIDVLLTDSDSTQRSGNGAEDAGDGSATIKLDGDGLNETTEAALGTDPLDFDSDSTETAADESDNGTIDGKEDFDDDGLTTLDEMKAGTDPLSKDTDEDGLGDGVEWYLLETDPLNPDSDADGVPDGEEDPDGDTIDTATELELQTLPWSADSDADGLRDDVERSLGTDPLNPDSDGDYLLDSEEVNGTFGTDPLDPDSNDNGIVDGNETYTTTASNESLGASVDIEGEGNLAAQTTINSPNNVRFDPNYAPEAAVSSFVSIETDANFSNATITIEYNESAVSTDEENLSLYRFNETRQGYEPVETTINASTNTATAETTEFSTWVVFENPAWVDYVTANRDLLSRANPEQQQNFSFESPPGSIAQSDWTCSPSNNSSGADQQNAPNPHASNGNCGFDTQNETIYVQERSRNQRYLNRTITLPDSKPLFLKVKAEGRTSIVSSRVRLSINADNQSVELMNIRSFERRTHADITRRVNMTQFAGTEIQISGMAMGSGGYYDSIPAQLDIYHIDIEAPSNKTVTTDSDGDGIPDFREVIGIPLANGPVVQLDPQDSDTDGDGIPDGEEVDYTNRVTQSMPDGSTVKLGYQWSSDPRTNDTDGDGLSDWTEQTGWSIETINRSGTAYQWAGGLESNGTISVDSNPKSTDSDDDGLSDFAEKTRTHTDPSGEVKYGIAGRVDTLFVSSYVENALSRDVLYSDTFIDSRDTDQDGIINAMEDKYGIPTTTSPIAGHTRMSLNSTDPDFDGDGVIDGQEFESERSFGVADIWPLQWYVAYQMKSHPKRVDSDSDGLNDSAERAFGTAPLDSNPDDDQFTDFRDPKPNTENIPPRINISWTPKIGGPIWHVGAYDSSGLDEFKTSIHFDDSDQSIEYNQPLSGGSSDEQRITIPDKAKNITITAVDKVGNKRRVVLNATDSGQLAVAENNVAVAGLPYDIFAIGGSLGSISPQSALIVGGIVFGIGSVVMMYNAATAERTTETIPVSQAYTPAIEPYNGGEIVLTEGYVDTAAGYTRGYGWAYISATSGVTRQEIENVVTGSAVVEGDKRKYLIGRDIAVITAGGVILSVSSEYAHDPCDQIVWTEDRRENADHDNEKGGPDHATRTEKPVNSLDRIKKLLESADDIGIHRILTTGSKRYYVLRLGPNKYITMVGKWFPFGWMLWTQLTYNGEFYKNYEDAKEDIPENIDEEIDPDVDC